MGKFYTSGSLGREIGTSGQWVRQLELMGVISSIRDESGRRLFSESELQKAIDHQNLHGRKLERIAKRARN